jgi:catechol 2,3-dioxygenase-like lactoylglutathione lyase family enzyme
MPRRRKNHVSIVTAHDVAYVRFSAPDLDVMCDFLTDFGMVVAHRTADALHMRGHGGVPFVHETTLGDPGFAGFGIWLKSDNDLRHLASAEGQKIIDLDTPGGGRCVRLTDPDGFTVDALFGQHPVPALAVPPHVIWNQGGQYPRTGEVRRVGHRPSHVMRLGHVVLGVSNFRRSEAWYKERFGFVTSDEIRPAPNVAIGAFMRCDRGDQPCDHHTLFLLERGGPPGFMHSAFEVIDFDDLMAGHEHLKERARDAAWGVGRHYLGSQIFDYWRDPWGHEIEHWTDGDQFRTRDGGGIATVEELMGVQWGMKMPPLPQPV